MDNVESMVPLVPLERLDNPWSLRDQPTVRDALIEQYLPLVRYVAARMKTKIPNHVEFDDLVSWGTFGLLGAVDRFEPERGYRFATFAIQRIRGAILDGMREVDWAPRSLRRDARTYEQAVSYVENQGEAATIDAVAARMGSSSEDVHHLIANIDKSHMGSISETFPSGVEEEHQPAARVDVEDVAVMSGLRGRVAAALTRVGGQSRVLAGLVYFEGMNLQEVGDLLGVTESRVCQMHTEFLSEVRAQACG